MDLSVTNKDRRWQSNLGGVVAYELEADRPAVGEADIDESVVQGGPTTWSFTQVVSVYGSRVTKLIDYLDPVFEVNDRQTRPNHRFVIASTVKVCAPCSVNEGIYTELS